MENSTHGTRNAIIATMIVGSICAVGYLLLKKQNAKAPASKSDMVVEILSQSGGEGDYNALMGLGTEYITAWYNAVKAKKPIFVVNNMTFDSVTGKQK